MSKRRARYRAQFKFQLALEAAKGLKTINDLASEHGVHPTPIREGKRPRLDAGDTRVTRHGARQHREQREQAVDLSEQSGRLKMALEWVKNKLPDAAEAKRLMIDVDIPHRSIRRPCDLLGLNRSTVSDAPATEAEDNLRLMRLMDAPSTTTPVYGWPRMRAPVRRLGLQVNHTRVQRLLPTMGLPAIYPKPRPSAAATEQTIAPDLLNAVVLSRPNQVWSADITYVRMTQGCMDVVAVIDWYRRYVLAWQLSNTMEPTFCRVALERALGQGAPMMVKTDQGVQFTSLACTGRLARAGMAISMDGRGRAFDNSFIERLWRSVKDEDIALNDDATVPALDEGLTHDFHCDNHDRPHPSVASRTPAQAHVKQPEDPVSRPPYF